MKRAVVTYIFGKDKELLREPLVVDEDVEYICVTDQKDLKSNVWKIVYDDLPLAGCIRDKMVYVKYRPFNYTDADAVCVIDGTIEIKKSLIPLFERLGENDILIKAHPGRTNLFDELNAWVRLRGMSTDYVEKFKMMAKHDGISLKNNFLLESCVLVFKKTQIIKELCTSVMSLMQFLGKRSCLFLSNQCCLAYLLQKTYKDVKYSWLNQSLFFNRYEHNTKKLNES